MEFKSKLFDQLTNRELYEIVRSRTEIFLLEQRIICQDFDGVDYRALHCFLEDGDRVVAYLRAYINDEGYIKIGRVLSLAHGQGLGTKLMNMSIPAIRETLGNSTICVNAQCQAAGFYKKVGFVVTSEEFLEENIPHVAMEYKEEI